ncbi:hypothetical protein [Thalassospira australica]|uniref:hypothetical protein n=1 Tax=Thalassospira australica TaxID=1528106 RepID=UPI0038512C9D
MKVSFSECYCDLVENGGPTAKRAYREWVERPGYGDVVSFVQNFDHEKLFSLSPDDIRETLEKTEHALGNVPKEHQIREIEDFTCPFALQHLFHRFIERTGNLPTWQRFWRWMNKQAKPHWLDQIAPLKLRLRENYSDQRIDDALRWRLGKFYYSAIREVEFLVWMHSQGIPLKYHLLADVLLRADYWIDRTILCTYAPNPRYRTSRQGRKNPAEFYFDGATPPFKIFDFEVEQQGFGRAWLTTEASKRQILERLRRELAFKKEVK